MYTYVMGWFVKLKKIRPVSYCLWTTQLFFIIFNCCAVKLELC